MSWSRPVCVAAVAALIFQIIKPFFKIKKKKKKKKKKKRKKKEKKKA